MAGSLLVLYKPPMRATLLARRDNMRMPCGKQAGMLPSLARLPRRALLDDPNSGVYCLDRLNVTEPCTSSVVLVRKALVPLANEYDELATFMRERVRQDSFMGHAVPRKQCTFGPIQYKTYQLISDTSAWPQLVTRALVATRAYAAQLGVPNPDEYAGVHANLYPDGNSTVQKHADDELQLVREAPIFSYTFIKDNNDAAARPFTIWKISASAHVEPASHHRAKSRLVDLKLFSGDLLVMQGDMQRDFHHSVERVLDGVVAERLNLTVRKFQSRKDAMRGAK
jgi:hypothetical protein